MSIYQGLEYRAWRASVAPCSIRIVYATFEPVIIPYHKVIIQHPQPHVLSEVPASANSINNGQPCQSPMLFRQAMFINDRINLPSTTTRPTTYCFFLIERQVLKLPQTLITTKTWKMLLQTCLSTTKKPPQRDGAPCSSGSSMRVTYLSLALSRDAQRNPKTTDMSSICVCVWAPKDLWGISEVTSQHQHLLIRLEFSSHAWP